MVGVVLSGTIGLILVIFLLFFGCRRCRARRHHHFGSMDDILALARQTVHRSPLDGDDESYLNTTRRPSQSSHHAALPSSQGHATDVGDLRSVEGGPQWSAESAHLSGAVPMSTSFGGRSDMAQVARIVEQKSVACDEIDHSEDQHPQDPEIGRAHV